MSAQELVKVIKAHGIQAHVTAAGKIEAADHYTVAGVAREGVATIDPTKQAVSDWLGY